MTYRIWHVNPKNTSEDVSEDVSIDSLTSYYVPPQRRTVFPRIKDSAWLHRSKGPVSTTTKSPFSPRIVQPRRHQHVRILRRFDVVDRGVALHVMVELFFLRVAPLLPLDRRQRNSWVQHRCKNVDERNPGKSGLEQVRAQVERGANQEPARRSTLYGNDEGA